MRSVGSVLWTLLGLAVVALVGWVLGLDAVICASVAAGHLLDWLMGGFCLIWLLVLLKAPWDLYFQAYEVAFELRRASERRIAVPEERQLYVRTLRRRLLWLAVGAHLFSSSLVAAIAALAGSVVGYYFAVFYLVSTGFRPAAAGYVYLWRRLRAISEEARYPREDVVELRQMVARHEEMMRTMARQWEECREALQAEHRELRRSVHAMSREFEAAASRVTDNEEALKGIQALARLVRYFAVRACQPS